MSSDGGVVYVPDTSSIIEVRRLLSGSSAIAIRKIYRSLATLAERGTLSVADAVAEEIRHHAVSTVIKPDYPYEWVSGLRIDTIKNAALFAEVRTVLARVPKLIDPNKTTGPDEADPYVVALALWHHSQGASVKVITEDRKDSPKKMSVGSVCGVFNIPHMSMRMFLYIQELMDE